MSADQSAPRRAPVLSDAMRGPGLWDWTAARAICLRETRRVLGSHPAAEDAAQEATLRAWRHSRRAPAPDSPTAWLATIARREALRIAAGGRELPVCEPPHDVAAPEPARALSSDMRQALETLAPADRELIFARYWGDETQSAIARRLNLPEGTAKVRLHRARARLREVLSES